MQTLTLSAASDRGTMIDGVKIVPLRQIVDERGKIMHMMRRTDPHFLGFGEIYFSCAWPGTVKAWHIHQTMTVNNAVISGRAKLVMYDLRQTSPTRGQLQEVCFGEDNYVLSADTTGHSQRLQGLRGQTRGAGELCDRAARCRGNAADGSLHPGNSLRLGDQTWLRCPVQDVRVW